MFHTDVRNRLVELIHPQFEDSREKFARDFSKKSAELASRGLLHSGARLIAHHDAAVQQMETRVNLVVECIKKVILAQGILYSNSLTQDVKEELEYFVPLSLWELPQSYPDVGISNAKDELIAELKGKRERVLKKATADLNLFIDELRTTSITKIVVNDNVGSSTYADILILDHQKTLLFEFVKADHGVSPLDKRKFIIVGKTGICTILHNGLPAGFQANISDVESLWDAGLLRQGVGSNGSYNFSVTPLGFKYAQWLMEATGEPIKRGTDAIREYLVSDVFKKRYGSAYAKWVQAEAALWGEESASHLTTIGHLCREALQEFVSILVDRHQPSNVNTDRTKTVDRMRAVLNHSEGQLGTTSTPFLAALLAYWGTLIDLVQRQEHGAQKEGEPLKWDDARRVVFQTAVVMFEVDRSLSSVK